MAKIHNSVDLYGPNESSSMSDDEAKHLGNSNWYPLSIKCNYLEHIFFLFIKSNKSPILPFYEHVH